MRWAAISSWSSKPTTATFVRDAQAALVDGAVGAGGRAVVAAEQGGGTVLEVEQRRGQPEALVGRRRRVEDEALVEGEACLVQRTAVAGEASGGGRGAGHRVEVDEADASVAAVDQRAGGQVAALLLVGDDGRVGATAVMAVDQDGRHLAQAGERFDHRWNMAA
jgi:hypothetical protein